MFDVPPGTDPAKAPRTRKKRRIPRSGTPAAIKAMTGLGWIFLFLKLSSWYNSEILLSDDYMKYGFLKRVWLLEMLGFTTRLKYYGVWSLTEGACILSGLGYKGLDPNTSKPMWNRLQNVNPWGIESAQNSRAYLENWNMNTNNWLRNYMYLRVTPKGKKPGFRASLVTFVTSAFWHGFYPGYYLSFLLAAFMQTVAKSQFILWTLLFSAIDNNRFPSSRKTIFSQSRWPETHSLQAILRYFILPVHPSCILLYDSTICHSHSAIISSSMVSCLLLCYRRRRYVFGFL